MNLRKKRGLHFGTCLFMIMLGWFSWFRSVNASQLFFPFIADDWISFEIQTPYIQCESLKGLGGQIKQETASQKEKSKQKEKKNTKKQPKKKYNTTLSKSEKEVLYKVVSMECDTGYDGSLAVISCMLNRLESDHYPDDLMDVVREDSQFTAYYDKRTDTYPYVDREPSEECIAAVEDALNKGKRNIPSYILYFRSSDYDYLKGYECYGQIGDNTYFYKKEDK